MTRCSRPAAYLNLILQCVVVARSCSISGGVGAASCLTVEEAGEIVSCVPHPPVLQGQVTISNDGATIMKLLDIVHPAAKSLVDVSLSQDAEVCS
jgi:hypothetical protein